MHVKETEEDCEEIYSSVVSLSACESIPAFWDVHACMYNFIYVCQYVVRSVSCSLYNIMWLHVCVSTQWRPADHDQSHFSTHHDINPNQPPHAYITFLIGHGARDHDVTVECTCLSRHSYMTTVIHKIDTCCKYNTNTVYIITPIIQYKHCLHNYIHYYKV